MKFTAVSVEEARTIAARRGPRNSMFRDLIREFLDAEIPAAKLDLSELGVDRNDNERKPQSVASALFGQIRNPEKGNKTKLFPVTVKLRNVNPEATTDEEKEYAVYLLNDNLTDTSTTSDEEAIAEPAEGEVDESE